MQRWIIAGLVGALCWGQGAHAGVPIDLPYPAETPSAEEIANQVFFVNHFYAVKNLFIQREAKRHVTVLASRAKGEKADINTLRRFLNNDYEDGVVRERHGSVSLRQVARHRDADHDFRGRR